MSERAVAALPLVALGEAMVAIAPREPGLLELVGSFTPFVAGAECNVAVGVSRLGVPAAFLGRVGDDPFGRMIRRQLGAEGIDSSWVQVDPDRPTAVFFKENRGLSNETRVYYYRQGSAGQAVEADPRWRELVERAGMVHVSGITAMISADARAAVKTLLRWAEDAGVPVAFCVNLRHKLGDVPAWRRVLEPLLGSVSLLFASEDELKATFGLGPEAVLTRLRPGGIRRIVVTRGADGATVYAPGAAPLAKPALAVGGVVDTVGAGDGLVAGYVAGYLRGLDEERCLDLGLFAGAMAVRSRGDSDGLPLWAEAEAHLSGRPPIER